MNVLTVLVFLSYFISCDGSGCEKKIQLAFRYCSDIVQFPIELQMANDSEFFQKLLKSQTNITDDESSGKSDLNCSDLVQRSDTEPSVHKQVPQSTPSTSSDVP